MFLLLLLLLSHNGMTGSDSQAWVMLRIGRLSSTEPQAKGAGQ